MKERRSTSPTAAAISFRTMSGLVLMLMIVTNLYLIGNLANLNNNTVTEVEQAIGKATRIGFTGSGLNELLPKTIIKKEEEDVLGRLVKELVEWSVFKGGYFHPNVEIRRFDPMDRNSFFGAFVNGPIGANETLIKIPGTIKLQLDRKKRKHGYWTQVCELAWLLKEEYDKGNQSDYLPYVSYVKAQSLGQIPAMWSPSGQHLLLRVQGDLNMVDDHGFVKPARMVRWIDKYLENDCLNDDTEYLNPFFVAMAIQRGYDYALIPIYDMLNSHEGKINSITRPSIYDEKGFGVYALKNLTKGDELFYSYYHCPDCGRIEWGTPEMLRDFGYVEQYPQTFYLDKDYKLVIDQDGQGGYSARCKKHCPPKSFVQGQLKRLADVLKDDIGTAKDYLPANEYNIIKQYHQAWTVAFETVLPLATSDQ